MVGEGKNDTGGERYDKMTFNAYSNLFFLSLVETVQ